MQGEKGVPKVYVVGESTWMWGDTEVLPAAIEISGVLLVLKISGGGRPFQYQEADPALVEMVKGVERHA